MPDIESRSKHYRDRAAEYLTIGEKMKWDYAAGLCRTIADHFNALADAEDKFVAEQLKFRQRFGVE